MAHPRTDLTIIGGGPTGLFAAFYAGMRGVSARIVDALPELGGQLTALYPEKYIFDVAGFPKILAKDLVRNLVEQTSRFQPDVRLGQRVVSLEQDGRDFVLVTDTDRFPTGAIVVAAGIGAFSPRRLPAPSAEAWYDKGIYDRVTDPAQFRGQRVLIVGGGDSAFDWAHHLAETAQAVTLVHRSDRFRAHDATVAAVRAAEAAGRVRIRTFHELARVEGEEGRLARAVLRDAKAKTEETIAVDAILPMLGFVSDLGAIAAWGLNLEKDEIVVTSTMETGRAGIYAAGDVTTYPGKLKLIATGFGEATTAVNQAVHWLYPEKKVMPGHSSNMAVFGQKED
ncbi:MAG TPA: NAD(P)/FAD-dependent oxidoreductase [Gemmatimonadaceae bacterium]|nr:NAD(P)/FAD-dependent oxidoreductase [Gemmatimonadaceae bacterium]